MNKNNAIVVTISMLAILMVAAPALMSLDQMADAHKKKGKKIKHNEAEQEIEQEQESAQSAQCVSGTIILASCNNFGLQFGLNTGNNALGQQ
ncbi:MAG: hypothetical protein M3162_08210 [Thermoproteota archaeon]|nr:hypothetical protein [Thermoproteota archaeon]